KATPGTLPQTKRSHSVRRLPPLSRATAPIAPARYRRRRRTSASAATAASRAARGSGAAAARALVGLASSRVRLRRRLLVVRRRSAVGRRLVRRSLGRGEREQRVEAVLVAGVGDHEERLG